MRVPSLFTVYSEDVRLALPPPARAGSSIWGYNYWYRSQTQELIDPFTEQSGFAWPVWAYGDPFLVYPGPDGLIDSLRWEVFAESLQDLALLQTLGIDPDDPMLSEIRDYNDFPKTRDWIASTRARLLS